MLVRTDAFVRLALITAITATTSLFAAPGTPPATKPATMPAALSGAGATPATLPGAAAMPATAPAAAAAPLPIPGGAAAPAPAELPAVTQAFVATITDNKVNVRSGPGTTYYEMGQLGKGDLVYVVGTSKDWYKILPPNGTFCMIAKEFVDADAAGATTGTVKADYINVRAGTAVSKRDPSAVLAVVRKGTRVQILGATDLYYQVAPPEQAYVYVSSQFIKAAPATEYKVAELKLPNAAANPFAHTVDAPTATPSIAALPVAAPGSTPASAGGSTGGATIEIPNASGTAAVETPGTTPVADATPVAPAVTFSAAAKTRFNDANTRFLQESKKPLAEQDVAGFTREFQDVLAMDGLSPTIQQGAQANLKALDRTATLQRLLKEQAASAEMTRQQTDALRQQLDASQKLIDSNKANQPFINEGVLKSSTVVAGKYALVNPQTGRTVAYIDPAGSSVDMSIFMNHYIGVRGEKRKVDGAEIEVITVRDATLMAQPGSVQ